MGSKVPDLRGLFLRGQGGNSASLGTVQNDNAYFSSNSSGSITFASTVGGDAYAGIYLHPSSGPYGSYAHNVKFDIAGIELTSTTGVTETRPKNMAVRYLIRALP